MSIHKKKKTKTIIIYFWNKLGIVKNNCFKQWVSNILIQLKKNLCNINQYSPFAFYNRFSTALTFLYFWDIYFWCFTHWQIRTKIKTNKVRYSTNNYGIMTTNTEASKPFIRVYALFNKIGLPAFMVQSVKMNEKGLKQEQREYKNWIKIFMICKYI